jgi:aminobenzoyl-glutamate utilization protein B
MVRDVDAESVNSLKERVDRIAKGAALMTDTEVKIRVCTAYASLITIPTLQAVANEAMCDIPLPVPTEEDLKFAKALQKTMTLTREQKNEPLYPLTVLPPAPPVAHGGSTDTADVSWNTPTVQMHIGTWVKGTPGHSWQSEAQGKSAYAKKAMLYAAKAVAGTVMRLFDSPDLLLKARAEHKERIGEGYVCGIPAHVMPDLD